MRLLGRAATLPSIKITMRNLCDLELLATGAFSPLDRFMGKADYERVLHEMRLSDGALFPLPITLTADPKELPTVGEDLVLRNANNDVIAVMTLDEVYHWDAETEAALAYGSTDAKHPMVSEMARWSKVCISGPIKVVNLPKYYDFVDLRRTPAQVRRLLEGMGNDNVVAFQTRNPLHRIHEELTKRAAAQVGGSLLIHPVVGMTKPGDVDHYTRVRIYKALVDNYYDQDARCSACCRWQCAWPDPRKCCCTPSSGATMAPTISSWDATTPGPERIRPASRSTVRTMRRNR